MKNWRSFLIVAVMALAAFASDPLYGQRIGVGERLRVNDALIGTVGSLDQEGLKLYLQGGIPRTFVPKDIYKLERSLGQGSHMKRGALIGGGLGGLMGLATSSTWSWYGGQGYAAVTVVLSTATYGGLGALIGYFIKTEKWETVPVSYLSGRLLSSPRLHLASIGDSPWPSLGVRVHFY